MTDAQHSSDASERSATLSVPPEFGMLVKLREFVRAESARCGLRPAAIDQLSLAVDEAATNIIEHAVRGMPQEITCTCQLGKAGDEMICTLDYESPKAFEPKPPPKLDSIRERVRSLARGGLGVYLVHSLVDRVEYARKGRRNVIVLTKRMS